MCKVTGDKRTWFDIKLYDKEASSPKKAPFCHHDLSDNPSECYSKCPEIEMMMAQVG